MRKNISLILFSSSILALPTLLAQDAKLTPKESKQSPAFTQALAEAERLSDTEEGKAYEGEFAKVVAPRLGNIVGECTKNLGPTVKFEVVFIFAADGRLEQLLGATNQRVIGCMREKFHDLHLPAPPHASWPVSLNIDISPNNAPRLLESALKLMEGGTWEVNATISRAFKFGIHGLLAGRDFDLTVEPQDRNAFRLIAMKDKDWSSYDGGKTWKLEDAKGHALAQRIYSFVHNPLRPEATSPALQVVKQETHDGDTWMQLRPNSSNKKKGESKQTEYWIAISQDPKRNGVRRYDGPVNEPGHEHEPLHCSASYLPVNNKTIQPPEDGSVSPPQQSPPPSSSPAASSSEVSARESSNDQPSANGGDKETTVSLLDGKLKLNIPQGFWRDPDDPKEAKTIAKFSGPEGAWGSVLRGTHGLTPEQLDSYLRKRVAEYSKGFNWLPKDSHLQWLKKDIVTIDGRKWADWSFVPILKGKKDYSHNPVYTRNFTTSYKGQLLEINFTTNLNTNPELKQEIDDIMSSIHLEE